MTSNKNSNKGDSVHDWKGRFNDLMSTAQTELKKTTKIGMKMLSASQSNSQLHETYENMGKWLYSQIQENKIDITSEEVLEMVQKVRDLEEQLKEFEQEVQDIKKE